MICKTIVEGTTKVLVPIPPKDATFPPSAAPVFYNPEMELNRDINVAATQHLWKGFFPKKRFQGKKLAMLMHFLLRDKRTSDSRRSGHTCDLK